MPYAQSGLSDSGSDQLRRLDNLSVHASAARRLHGAVSQTLIKTAKAVLVWRALKPKLEGKAARMGQKFSEKQS